MPAASGSRSAAARFAWLVLAYVVAVIVWGAFVRATGSGAGCGAHWPLCNGEVVPRAPGLRMVIEFSHRVTSGLSLVAVVALAVVAFRATRPGHPARAGALGAVGFMILEALLGAALVLFGLVADDRRPIRAVVLGVHLTNTFLLLATIALTARWLGDPSRRGWPLRAGRALGEGAVALAGVVAVAVTGGIAALGDTLFPAGSLAEGVAHDLSPAAHVLVRLRVWHPVIAVLVGLGLWAYAEAVRRNVSERLAGAARRVEGLVALQVVAGTVNLLLLAPTALQLVHLLLADLVWIALVLLVAGAVEQAPAPEPAAAPVAGAKLVR